MIQTGSRIVSNEQIAKDRWHMTLEAPRIAAEVIPGQFINVKIEKPNAPLFRRPFSVFRRISFRGGVSGIEVVYKVVGIGTEMMSSLGPGDEVDVIGPLGHGFEWHRDRKVHVLLAGGMGAMGLFMLGEEISTAVYEFEFDLYILLGAGSKTTLLFEREFSILSKNVLVSTDDGTYGYKGFVTDMLMDLIIRENIASRCAIYACGPEPMYKSLAAICRQYDIHAQVSVERHRAYKWGQS
jgi:dihydroorotate dehydrogenase electron transfer subunit